MTAAVIVDVIRTASGKGKPGGQPSGIHPADLLSRILRTLVERNDIAPELIEDVIGGCASQAGQQACNITRCAVLGAACPRQSQRLRSTAGADPASRRRILLRRVCSPVPTTWSSPAASSR